MYIDEAHELAQKSAGASDFGDPKYQDGMSELVHAWEADCNLGSGNLRTICNGLASILVGRLYAHRGFAENPVAMSAKIERPLIIIGLPRTGTTALHHLLSQDPQFQILPSWIAERPMTRPPRESWEQRSEFRESVDRFEQLNTRIPSWPSIHQVAADEPEECNRVLLQNFAAWGLGVMFPSYAEWLRNTDMSPSYSYYFNVLRLVGAREPDKTWLLKDPFHIHDLDSLLSVAPDARLIQIHRDPVSAIPSWYSLIRTLGTGELRNHVHLASQLCDFWKSSLHRAHMVRQRHAENFFDVEHRDFAVAPLRTVRSIYDHFGMALTPQAERRMFAWAKARSDLTKRHGHHEYNLTSIDITIDQLLEKFAEYRAQHAFN